MKHFLWVFIPYAALSSIFSLTLYIAVQQAVRGDANDPQIQMAEDGARLVAKGSAPNTLVSQLVDLKESLAPFVLVFDAGGNPVAAGATLDGQTPIPPRGVFDDAARSGESRFTWEPETGIREAVVMTAIPAGDGEAGIRGFVLAGRSLYEVEKREGALGLLVSVSWILTILLSFVYSLFVTRRAVR